jgi:hypothetical protein
MKAVALSLVILVLAILSLFRVPYKQEDENKV